MFTLLSNRMKNEKNEPEVYIYDQLPASFRTQVFYIIEDVLENYCKYGWKYTILFLGRRD